MNPTASAIGRVLVCPASAVLPHEQYENEYADEGTANHAEVEDAIGKGDTSKLPLELADLLDGMEIRSEVAVAYNVATGEARELGQGLGRNYGPLDVFEVAGTCDLLAVGNGKLLVGDGKLYAEVTHPSRNPQLLTLGLAFSKLYGVSEATLAIYHLDGSDRVRLAQVDTFDLEAHAIALHDMQVRVAAAHKDPLAHLAEGPHCRHCPAFAACPKKQNLVVQIKAGAADDRLALLLPLQDDRTAAEALEFLRQVEQLTKRLKSAVIARAKQRPIPLPNGKLYGLVPSLGNREIDGDKAYTFLREKFGQTVADAAVTREASQKSIKDALVKAGIGATGKSLERLLEELDKAGGISRKQKLELDEYEPKPQLAVGGGK